MPSPFPGMDPFLENPEYFPDLHDSLIYCLQETLQPRLPEPYFAKKGRRVWLEQVGRQIGPDAYVLRAPGPTGRVPDVAEIATVGETGAVAVVADPEPDPVIEIREPYLEIYTGAGDDKRLVTTIEVLSPTNKTQGGQGRSLYRRKQQEMLERDVHLIEIDLLRGGVHTTAVPWKAVLEKVGPFDYHVCLHKFDQPKVFHIYPIRLQSRLPEIAVPLLPGDPTVTVDLQPVFDRSYDSGPFRREVRYREETPQPPLTAEQKGWARERVENWNR